ncbi:hypothetical protein FOZ61_007804 [Perkinsus olseni]|uniref:Uncharacterized protein n=1 Tax=Perkinsus olseni TaxID=32597 RepID=A0A7J6MPT8_PEROL|nr:hypothetical protein FOZ61_007804 [Perkinsus olseni]KAF4673524.1 hypothetical protein FOL46_007014 [Perkinsus olseni]
MYFGKAHFDHEVYDRDMPLYGYDMDDKVPTTTIERPGRSGDGTRGKWSLEDEELYMSRLARREQMLRARANSGGKRYCCGKLDKNGCGSCVFFGCTALVATVALLFTFIFGPMLAQGMLDEGAVNVESVIFLGVNETACAGSAANICLDAIVAFNVQNPSFLGVKLDEFTVSVYHEGSKFASIGMPDMSLDSGENSVNETVLIVVTDLAAFDRLGSVVVTEPSVAITAKGAGLEGKSWWISLKDLEFDREISIGGFNGFRDYQPRLLNANFRPGQSTIDHAVYLGTLQFLNPTNFTILDLGSFAAFLYFNGEQVGGMLTESSMGVRSRSFTDVTAVASFATTGATAQLALALAKNLVDGKDVTVTIKGYETSNAVWTNIVESVDVSMLMAAR